MLIFFYLFFEFGNVCFIILDKFYVNILYFLRKKNFCFVEKYWNIGILKSKNNFIFLFNVNLFV